MDTIASHRLMRLDAAVGGSVVVVPVSVVELLLGLRLMRADRV